MMDKVTVQENLDKLNEIKKEIDDKLDDNDHPIEPAALNFYRVLYWTISMLKEILSSDMSPEDAQIKYDKFYRELSGKQKKIFSFFRIFEE